MNLNMRQRTGNGRKKAVQQLLGRLSWAELGQLLGYLMEQLKNGMFGMARILQTC